MVLARQCLTLQFIKMAKNAVFRDFNPPPLFSRKPYVMESLNPDSFSVRKMLLETFEAILKPSKPMQGCAIDDSINKHKMRARN